MAIQIDTCVVIVTSNVNIYISESFKSVSNRGRSRFNTHCRNALFILLRQNSNTGAAYWAFFVLNSRVN